MSVVDQNGVPGKACPSCKMWKPLSEFSKDPSHGPSQGYRHCRCKNCYNIGRRKLGY